MFYLRIYFLFRDTTFHLVLAIFTSLRPKYGTPYLFTSAKPKHTLLSDVILRRTTFTQPILPPSGPGNVPWISSETLVLYKSLTYLLTYIVDVWLQRMRYRDDVVKPAAVAVHRINHELSVQDSKMILWHDLFVAIINVQDLTQITANQHQRRCQQHTDLQCNQLRILNVINRLA